MSPLFVFVYTMAAVFTFSLITQLANLREPMSKKREWLMILTSVAWPLTLFLIVVSIIIAMIAASLVGKK